AELEMQMADPNFWNDQDNAQKIINEANGLKSYVNSFEEIEERWENMEVSYELVKEENDQELFDDLQEELAGFISDVNEFEL
ncbi:PCRF domain-containing protein, partial [Staphylococcus sp. SIMBA_130]